MAVRKCPFGIGSFTEDIQTLYFRCSRQQ